MYTEEITTETFPARKKDFLHKTSKQPQKIEKDAKPLIKMR